MAKIPTTVITLRKKLSTDTEGYLKIKMWVPGTDKFVLKSTGYKVSQDYWDAVNCIVKRGYPDYDTINREIRKVYDTVTDALEAHLRSGNEFTHTYLTSLVKPPHDTEGFLAFYNDHVAYIGTKHSVGYYKHYQVEYNSFCKFVNNRLAFSDVNAALLQRYEISLASKAPTTISTKLKRLKEVVDKAIAYGHIKAADVAGYKWPTYVSPERPYLTLAQTESIWGNIATKRLYDNDQAMLKVACYFLIECYAGIRFSDWHRFTIETLLHRRNLKVRAKKNGEPVYIPLDVFKSLAKVVDYIRDNKIVFDQTEGNTNRLLKIIARDAKIPSNINLTTHIGRHTAGTLFAEAGYSTRAIADLLGISEQTAQVYVKSTRKGLDNEFKKYGGF